MQWLKNWKSTSAFFIFVGIYVYSCYKGKSADTLEVVGDIALYSSLFMMFRSNFTNEMISKLIDKIHLGR